MIHIIIWYLCGIVAATICNNHLNKSFDLVTTRADLVWIMAAAVSGPIFLAGVGLVWLIDRAVTFFEKDFWSKPLFKEKK